MRTAIILMLLASLILCASTKCLLGQDNAGRDWGFDCEIPIEVDLSSPAQFPYVSNKTTCGMVDDYSATCLENYDGGEDVIYRIELGFSGFYPFKFVLDPMGTSWTGMVLSTECPAAGASFEDCLAYSVNDGSGAYSFDVMLTEPGTYYLMIDTWPSPNCIPEYELQIIYMYDKCSSAAVVNLPEDAVYTDNNQTTCGLYNFYDETCMGNYDNGQEKLYKIIVTESAEYRFRLDPKDTPGVGVALAENQHCPPGQGVDDCIAFYTTDTGDKIQFHITLEPDIYFLMIDTWPSPKCIPDYDLTIDIVPQPYVCGDANSDQNVGVSDAVYIINYIFVGGFEIDPIQSADVNCDNSINISDAVYIINWIFVGGHSPCDIDGNGVPNC